MATQYVPAWRMEYGFSSDPSCQRKIKVSGSKIMMESPGHNKYRYIQTLNPLWVLQPLLRRRCNYASTCAQYFRVYVIVYSASVDPSCHKKIHPRSKQSIGMASPAHKPYRESKMLNPGMRGGSGKYEDCLGEPSPNICAVYVLINWRNVVIRILNSPNHPPCYKI